MDPDSQQAKDINGTVEDSKNKQEEPEEKEQEKEQEKEEEKEEKKEEKQQKEEICVEADGGYSVDQSQANQNSSPGCTGGS